MNSNISLSEILKEFNIEKNRQVVNKNPYVQYVGMNFKESIKPKKVDIDCDYCGLGVSHLIPGKNIGVCDQCKATRIHVNFHNYQKTMMKDKAEQKIYVAAPGVGKTTASAAEWFIFANEFPNSTILCLAPTVINLRNVAQQELGKYFIKVDDKQGFSDFLIKNDDEWKLKNGSRFLWVASDKEEKVRGENANGVWALEVNSFKEDILGQLEIRTRSINNAIFSKDSKGNLELSSMNDISRLKIEKTNRKIIFETNNDADLIRDNYVLNSDMVFYTKYVPIDKFILNHRKKASEIINNRHTYIIDMVSSPNQDESYLINMLKKGSMEHRLTHIFCDMFYQDREIIKNWSSNLKYQLPQSFQFRQYQPYPIFHISDFGQTMANTTILTIAFEPHKKEYWIIDVYSKKNLTIREHAQNMIDYKRKYENDNFFEVVHAGDNSANQHKTNIDDITTLSNQYKNLGVYINTKLKGLKHPDNAIIIVNKLIEDKKLFIYGECRELINELTKYRRVKVKATGEKKLPRGNRAGMTFDLIDSLYMFSMLITLPKYNSVYGEEALLEKRLRIKKTGNQLNSVSSFKFLQWN